MNKSYIFGLKHDLQTATLMPYFDFVFYFDEFMQKWNYAIQDNSLILFDGINKFEIDSTDSIYLRGPNVSEDNQINNLITIFVGYVDQKTNSKPSRTSILNKLTQLRDFGSAGIKTYIFNNTALDLPLGSEYVVKSISNEKVVVCPLRSCQLSKSPVQLPTMIQTLVSGQEYKVHGVFFDGKPHLLAVNPIGFVNILAKDPYLNLLQRKGCINERLFQIAEKIHLRTGSCYFDFDVFVDLNENVEFIEWNNSICIAPLELEILGIPALSLSLFLIKKNIIIGQASDSIMKTLKLAHPEEALQFLHIEDFSSKAKSWNVIDVCGFQFIILNSKLLVPNKIYIRLVPVSGDQKWAAKLNTMYSMLEWFNCEIIGKISQQYINGSKPMQMMRSIAPVISKLQDETFVIPPSYIYKGPKESASKFLPLKDCSLIVKSMSGERSIVADQATFQRWNFDSLQNLPTFFQKKIYGKDLRVHSIDGVCFGISVDEKSDVDYRYSKVRSPMKSFEVPEKLNNFCKLLNKIESNPLLGVDFLEQNGKYFCLEANPSPGWSWYYPNRSEFSERLLGYLNYNI